VPPWLRLPRALSALLALGSCGLLQRRDRGSDGRVPGHPAGDDDVDPAQQGGGAAHIRYQIFRDLRDLFMIRKHK